MQIAGPALLRSSSLGANSQNMIVQCSLPSCQHEVILLHVCINNPVSREGGGVGGPVLGTSGFARPMCQARLGAACAWPPSVLQADRCPQTANSYVRRLEASATLSHVCSFVCTWSGLASFKWLTGNRDVCDCHRTVHISHDQACHPVANMSGYHTEKNKEKQLTVSNVDSGEFHRATR